MGKFFHFSVEKTIVNKKNRSQKSLSIPSILFLPSAVFLFTLFASTEVVAQANTAASLKGVPIPTTPNLLDGASPIVTNKQAAIQLGKALFWDTAVGSDGMACASCHFHAGADNRTINQLSTGRNHPTRSGKTFQATASGGIGGANYTLKLRDFPFYQVSDVFNKESTVQFNSDDIVSSSGVFSNKFEGLNVTGSEIDQCLSMTNNTFHLDTLNTRKVQDRNVPTVINAAFNFRNFWDGRANNTFNGVSAFGARDVNAGIWVLGQNGKLQKQAIRLENASLASQAVSPPLNSGEMSCQQRRFPTIGRKLLARHPLANQEIHAEDSVLATLRDSSGKGLNTSYEKLVKAAFAPRYWSATHTFGTAKYSQMEANFSFFFGLALKLYQDTLISDNTPFDSPRDTSVYPSMPTALNDAQKRGLIKFLDAGCDVCHMGPTFSSAAHPNVYRIYNGFSALRLVNRDLLNGSFIPHSGTLKPLMDEGYFNTSVTPENYDLGVGGTDPFGNPLSFSEQFRQRMLTGKAFVDPVVINTCDMNKPFTEDHLASELVKDPYTTGNCGSRIVYAKIPNPAVLQADIDKGKFGRAFVATKGAFKVPTLRNIELTGPYMHNGSMATLEQVVEFYFRGGNFQNDAHFAALVLQQPITPQEKSDLVDFLKSLTDERVRWERAPFAHPQLKVPHGHQPYPSATNPQQAEDNWLEIPAVGKKGRDARLGAIKAFHTSLAP